MDTPEIKIFVNEQLDGCTYQLDSRSRAFLQQTKPDAKSVASVFVSFNNDERSKWTEGDLWQHVAEMLSGLTTKQLKAVGHIVFVDPKTKAVVLDTVGENV